VGKIRSKQWGLFFLITILCLPIMSLEAKESGTPGELSMPAVEPEDSTPPPSPTETQSAEPEPAEQPVEKPAEASEEQPTAKSTEQPMQPRKHLVQPGDTLWSISTAYLSDPFYWPKVWDANQFIKNPDRIYPGSEIMLPTPEGLKAAPVKEAAEAVEPVPVEEEPATEAAEAPKETTPEPSVIIVEEVHRPLDAVLLASEGYLSSDKIDHAGVVIGDKDHKVLLGEGDTVYLKRGNAPSKEGDALVVYRKIRSVYHPKTDRYLGKLVNVLGIMKVTEVHPKITTAKILKSYNYILSGDLVAPYESVQLPSLEEVPFKEKAQVDGYVVDIKEDKVAIAQFDVVYIDKGIGDGIGRGSSFKVVRDGERTSVASSMGSVRLPPRTIGELEVITANVHTATAKVRRSTEPIFRGDRIETLSVR
jgi:hypothetical protein